MLLLDKHKINKNLAIASRSRVSSIIIIIIIQHLYSAIMSYADTEALDTEALITP